ncbi:DNA polymerase IV [Actinomadura rudentiformis]|uniref:DNA polymerase IV n=1 Tax=Actinomadura rudentiformis TaxID=359158 RepID=A0A6H9YMU8_9ACTN|nr:DNA polymerase IV [Actinomadura rudentiformis]KAB2348274.1 DNA polymerase IV [Actinomadura rudentiformis]
MAPWVLHVDLDQFVAAVEVLRRPELRGLPVVVGGDGDPTARRAVVSTASYEARAFGVHSGLPLRTAARRCPQAVFLPVDAPAYEAASARVMATLRTFDAVVEVWGWDEAFLAAETGDPEAMAREIQRRVREATDLECTVGIGENKLQAKLAAGYGKPAGVFRLTGETWFGLLGDRPVDALWGIGGKTAKRLAELGITTVRELAGTDPQVLATAFGPTIGPRLVQVGQGHDDSAVVGEPYVPRSRGRETTFQNDLDDWADVRREVARLARELATEVAAEQRVTQRVAVKVRFVPFNTYTRQYKLKAPTADPAEIERAALAALDRFTERRAVRLLGVRTEFVHDPESERP